MSRPFYSHSEIVRWYGNIFMDKTVWIAESNLSFGFNGHSCWFRTCNERLFMNYGREGLIVLEAARQEVNHVEKGSKETASIHPSFP
jgi:hypothetical protein